MARSSRSSARPRPSLTPDRTTRRKKGSSGAIRARHGFVDPIRVGSFQECASYPSRNSWKGGKTGVWTPAGTVSNAGKSTSVRSETGKGTRANDWVFLRRLGLRRPRINDSTTSCRWAWRDRCGSFCRGRARDYLFGSFVYGALTTKLRDQVTSAPGAPPRHLCGATSGRLDNGMPNSRAGHASRSCGRNQSRPSRRGCTWTCASMAQTSSPTAAEGVKGPAPAVRHEAGHTPTDENLQRAAAPRTGKDEIIGIRMALLVLCPPLRTRWNHCTSMRMERSLYLPWRFCRSGPPQTHMFFCLFQHSLGSVTYGLVGVGQRI